jgi:hypothetical protein
MGAKVDVVKQGNIVALPGEGLFVVLQTQLTDQGLQVMSAFLREDRSVNTDAVRTFYMPHGRYMGERDLPCYKELDMVGTMRADFNSLIAAVRGGVTPPEGSEPQTIDPPPEKPKKKRKPRKSKKKAEKPTEEPVEVETPPEPVEPVEAAPEAPVEPVEPTDSPDPVETVTDGPDSAVDRIDGGDNGE